MDNRMSEALYDSIKNAIEELDNLEAGTTEMVKQTEIIARLCETAAKLDKQETELQIEKDRLQLDREIADADRTEKEFRRAIDEDKIETDKVVNEGAKKLEIIKICCDVGKLLLVVGATGVQQKRITEFETTGIVRSKAWSMLPNIKNMIKH